jgi:transcriptional regulator with XRE-family HTH domain/tetratricopeptide (TPR) repeat protein
MADRRQRLAQRRRAVGLSQESLASRLDVERSTVVRWETGETEPLAWIRPKLARALRVSVDQLDELLETEPRLTSAHERSAPPEAAPSPPTGSTREASPVCQLPPAVTDFTGREPQITELVELLGGHDGDRVGVPVAVISGLPGAGKTTLALQVAHKARSAFPDGQLWVHLEGATDHPRDPGEVLGELVRALGVQGSVIPTSMPERASLYRSLLADRRILVLADDAVSAAQVQPLLPGTGQCAVLITSRSELAGPPGARLVHLEPLANSEAVQLLTQILGQRRIADEPGAAEELAEACGLLPLAVRIAGARLAARSSWRLSALARRITHARHRLDELQSGDLSVRASLTQSYQALDEPARRAFSLLALLASAEITEWQVAALLGTEDAADVVNQLADSSLLGAAGMDDADQPRYRCHDLLRDYAAERLSGEPVHEQDAAVSRVIDGWLQLAALANVGVPREPYFPAASAAPSPAIVPEFLARSVTASPMAWFTTERLGMLAAIERSCSVGRYQTAAQLASSMAGFQHFQGRVDDAERTWRIITAAASQARDRAATARAQLRLAAAICGQGRHAEASPIVDQCTRTFHELADKHGLATALYWRAVCEWNLGAYADARQSADRAVHLARSISDRQTELLALRIRAIALANLPGQREEAIASAEQARRLVAGLGHATLEHEILHSVANVYNLVGRHADALHLGQDGLALGRDLGVQELADWLGLLGDAYHGLGRYSEAAESLRSALPFYRDRFMRRHHALCLLKMGYAYQAMDDCRAAISHLRDSLDIFEQLQLAHYTERARNALTACQTGQLVMSDQLPSG